MDAHIENLKASSEIRKSYELLPFQGIWSWLTGKEIIERQKLWKSSSIEMIIWSIAWVITGLGLTIASLHIDNIFIYLATYLTGILFSASGARYIVATIIHHGVHGHLFKNKITNKIICEILSTAFIVQPYEPYRRFHVYEHHGKDFASFKDKDLSAIYKLGFTPGKTRQQLYKNLFKLLLSPTFHISYFKGRVTSNLTGIQPYRIAMSLIWMSFLLTTLTIYGALPFTLVVIIPFVIIYQMASLLHLITEHTWLLRPADKTVRDSHIENCLARFCGSLCPNDFSSKNIWPWIKWGVAHIFYHLPCRMLIVQGSLVCHDWHHRFGSVREWYNYSTLREIDVHKQVSKSTYKYIDIWGFKNCLDYVFGKISEAPITNTQNFEYRLN